MNKVSFLCEYLFVESFFNSKQKIRKVASALTFASVFVRHVIVFRLLQKVNVMVTACVSTRTLDDIAFSRAR